MGGVFTDWEMTGLHPWSLSGRLWTEPVLRAIKSLFNLPVSVRLLVNGIGGVPWSAGTSALGISSGRKRRLIGNGDRGLVKNGRKGA